MAKRRQRKSRLQRVGADVLAMVTSAREASKTALQQLRQEIGAARRQLEKLVTEERSFRFDLFGNAPGRSRGAAKSRKPGQPAGRKAVARRAKPRRKGPAKADKFLAKLPVKFTIDDVRKVAGKATGISLAQWARSKKVKKTASGYQKVA
jgi:hypothetical protein